MSFDTITYAAPCAVALRSQLPPPPYFINWYGPPGGGKGTQVKRFAAMLGCEVVALGDPMRAIAADPHHPHQALCAEIMQQGKLAPTWLANELTFDLTDSLLSRLGSSKGILFDGVTRTALQAAFLDGMLRARGWELDLTIELDVSAANCRHRLLGQNGRQRSDDQPQIVSERLQIYEQNRGPVMAAYYTDGYNRRPIGRTMDANGDKDALTEQLIQLLPGWLAEAARLT